jgi:hypothetical protein
MSVAAAMAAAFWQEVVTEGAVWTVRDDAGCPAHLNSQGVRAQPFWSRRSRAERILRNVPAYRGMTTEKVGLDDWTNRWRPDLRSDGIRVGINWSGQSATGYDITVDEAVLNLQAALERAQRHG